MTTLTDNNELLRTPCANWQTRQAIVLDWHDGPIEGVCALAKPKFEFFFELYSDKHNSRGLDDRLYVISQIKDGSVNRILRALKALGEPTSPVWAPVWKFAKEADRVKAERVIESVLNAKRGTGVIVRTQDMKEFNDCLNIARDTKRFLSWFEYKGPSVEREFAGTH
ncbi:MAG TPA: hypothetical protein VKX17_21950 [Planctomycetota bacterium]|nr:hypothetical protein [Planctomycetota bacterium]